MTFEEFQDQYVENEIEYEYFCGFDGDCHKYRKAQEDVFKQALADERAKVIDEVKQYLLKHKKTVKEFETKHIYDAVKVEWIIDLNEGELEWLNSENGLRSSGET